MEVVVVALRPKIGFSITQDFQPKLFDILLTDLQLGAPADNKPKLKQLPKAVISYEDETSEALATFLYQVTGAEKGGMKGKRALFIPQSQSQNERTIDSREPVVSGMLYCIPIDSRDKLNSTYVNNAPHKPAFYSLDAVLNAVNNSPQNYTKQTKMMLLRLQGWLNEKYTVPGAVDLLFCVSSHFRLKFSVTNPAYFDGKAVSVHLDQYERSIANEAMTKMMAIEKCDITKINPVFGTGLPFQDQVEAFAINIFWGLGEPDYSKITVPSMRSINERLNEPNWIKDYPLHKAAVEGNAYRIRELIEKGYDVSQPDAESWAPIHYAAWYGHLEAIQVLLREGDCSPNLKTDNWSTPLHCASTNGHAYVVELLLSHTQIDVGILDRSNKSPLDLCENVDCPNRKRAAILLKTAMSRPCSKLQVYLMDSTYRMMDLVSGSNTTVQQIHAQMMKELCLPEEYSRFFTLWICSRNLELQLKPEQKPLVHLNDWNRSIIRKLTDQVDPSSDEPLLYWRREAILSMQQERLVSNPVAINLLFWEAYQKYIKSTYLCKDTDILQMGGILMQLHHGDYNQSRADSFFSYPDNLHGLVPSAKLRKKLPATWVPKIQQQYQNYSRSLANKDRSPPVLQMEFLRLCWNLTVYGSAMFTGHVQYKSSKHPTKVNIGVNDIGIHIMDAHKKNLLTSFKYSDIVWNQTEEAILMIRLQGSTEKESALAVKTKQARLIKNLMNKLSSLNAPPVANVLPK